MAENDRLFDERLRKLGEIRQLGVDPYGGRMDGIRPLAEAREAVAAREMPDGERAADLRFRLAGRILLLRIMGKLAFLTVHDRTGPLRAGPARPEWAWLSPEQERRDSTPQGQRPLRSFARSCLRSDAFFCPWSSSPD